MRKPLLIGTILLLAFALFGCTQSTASADVSGTGASSVSPSASASVAASNASGLTAQEQAELDALSRQMAKDDSTSDFDIDTSLD